MTTHKEHALTLLEAISDTATNVKGSMDAGDIGPNEAMRVIETAGILGPGAIAHAILHHAETVDRAIRDLERAVADQAK